MSPQPAPPVRLTEDRTCFEPFHLPLEIRFRDAMAFMAVPFPFLITPAGWTDWLEEHLN